MTGRLHKSQSLDFVPSSPVASLPLLARHPAMSNPSAANVGEPEVTVLLPSSSSSYSISSSSSSESSYSSAITSFSTSSTLSKRVSFTPFKLLRRSSTPTSASRQSPSPTSLSKYDSPKCKPPSFRNIIIFDDAEGGRRAKGQEEVIEEPPRAPPTSGSFTTSSVQPPLQLFNPSLTPQHPETSLPQPALPTGDSETKRQDYPTSTVSLDRPTLHSFKTKLNQTSNTTTSLSSRTSSNSTLSQVKLQHQYQYHHLNTLNEEDPHNGTLVSSNTQDPKSDNDRLAAGVFPYASPKDDLEFHAIFPSIPSTERLIEDFPCTFHPSPLSIPVRGRLYISPTYLSFTPSTNLQKSWSFKIASIQSIQKRKPFGGFRTTPGLEFSLKGKVEGVVLGGFLERDVVWEMVVVLRERLLEPNSTTTPTSRPLPTPSQALPPTTKPIPLEDPHLLLQQPLPGLPGHPSAFPAGSSMHPPPPSMFQVKSENEAVKRSGSFRKEVVERTASFKKEPLEKISESLEKPKASTATVSAAGAAGAVPVIASAAEKDKGNVAVKLPLAGSPIGGVLVNAPGGNVAAEVVGVAVGKAASKEKDVKEKEKEAPKKQIAESATGKSGTIVAGSLSSSAKQSVQPAATSVKPPTPSPKDPYVISNTSSTPPVPAPAPPLSTTPAIPPTPVLRSTCTHASKHTTLTSIHESTLPCTFPWFLQNLYSLPNPAALKDGTVDFYISFSLVKRKLKEFRISEWTSPNATPKTFPVTSAGVWTIPTQEKLTMPLMPGVDWWRVQEYYLPLTNPLGPKQTRCVVKEWIEAVDYEKGVLCLKSETRNPDIFEGFKSVLYTCVSGTAKGVKVKVGATIEFERFSLIKGAITLGAVEGLKYMWNTLLVPKVLDAWAVEGKSELAVGGAGSGKVEAQVQAMNVGVGFQEGIKGGGNLEQRDGTAAVGDGGGERAERKSWKVSKWGWVVIVFCFCLGLMNFILLWSVLGNVDKLNRLVQSLEAKVVESRRMMDMEVLGRQRWEEGVLAGMKFGGATAGDRK
ncbi:hypothetical protein HDV05_007935 [Chytridiales sp. JEL 0842]|nr:hypothetical protein HDV05_007935 [Chytridiales sp. JEL 0842]